MTHNNLSIKMGQPSSANIGAVVVAYNPDHEFLNRIELLSSQVCHVVIVDNASDRPVALLSSKQESVISIVRNEENLGVAAALNQGIAALESVGCEWVATFDQDSCVTEDYVETMSAVVRSYVGPRPLGVIGAGYGARESEAKTDSRAGYELVKTVITSGSLARLGLFSEIGTFLEWLFIDHVDHEFCLRARSAGLEVIRTTRRILVHEIGAVRTLSVLGLRVSVSLHSPERYFFKYRNMVYMNRRFFSKFPLWVVKMNVKKIFLILPVLFFSGDRTAVIKEALAGFRSGFRPSVAYPELK